MPKSISVHRGIQFVLKYYVKKNFSIKFMSRKFANVMQFLCKNWFIKTNY